MEMATTPTNKSKNYYYGYESIQHSTFSNEIDYNMIQEYIEFIEININEINNIFKDCKTKSMKYKMACKNWIFWNNKLKQCSESKLPTDSTKQVKELVRRLTITRNHINSVSIIEENFPNECSSSM
jgi:hypothetical protein